MSHHSGWRDAFLSYEARRGSCTDYWKLPGRTRRGKNQSAKYFQPETPLERLEVPIAMQKRDTVMNAIFRDQRIDNAADRDSARA